MEMEKFIEDVAEYLRREDESQEIAGETALVLTQTLNDLMAGRTLRDMTQEELAGVMILCVMIMRLCVKATSPYAGPSFALCADIFAKAGAISQFNVPRASILELLEQLKEERE